MCHTFLVVTVKIWLKSVYIYGSYSKIKTGVPLFWTTLYAKFGMKYLSVTSSVATSGHTGGHMPTLTRPCWVTRFVQILSFLGELGRWRMDSATNLHRKTFASYKLSVHIWLHPTGAPPLDPTGVLLSLNPMCPP